MIHVKIPCLGFVCCRDVFRLSSMNFANLARLCRLLTVLPRRKVNESSLAVLFFDAAQSILHVTNNLNSFAAIYN